jgi:hypothetical protein
MLQVGRDAALKAFDVAGRAGSVLGVVMGVMVVELIYPSLQSASTALASNKLELSGSGSSSNQAPYNIGRALSSKEIVNEAGVIDAVNKGASHLHVVERVILRHLPRMLSSRPGASQLANVGLLAAISTLLTTLRSRDLLYSI